MRKLCLDYVNKNNDLCVIMGEYRFTSQLDHNPRVGGSSPSSATNLFNDLVVSL